MKRSALWIAALNVLPRCLDLAGAARYWCLAKVTSVILRFFLGSAHQATRGVMISNCHTAHRVRQWSVGVGLAGAAAVTGGMIAAAA
jgi:hypothetical protein